MYNPQIETFVKVAEAGSFSKASEKMYISTTAVIKQINLLEKELDLSLFVRTHRGLTLTKAGESLYKDAKYIIEYSKDAIARAKQAMAEANDKIRIGVSPMTPADFLWEMQAKIAKQIPNLKFQLVPFNNTPEKAREILQNLGKNIDIVAGIYDEAFLKSRECVALNLSMEPIYVAVSVRHRLATKDRLDINDLSGEEVMLIEQGWNTYIDVLRQDISNYYPQINIVDFSFYSMDIFNQCENNNRILTVIDRWVNTHPLVKVIPVDWQYKVPFGLLHSPKPNAYVDLFLQAVHNIIAK